LSFGFLKESFNQPIIMIIKAVCDSVEDLEPIGELLGD
jgi:hypothetical protein